MRMIALIGLIVVTTASSSAQESGRIKRAPPSPAEQDRLASEMALNDSLLQKGDIIATDRGFVIFRGLAPDGTTADVAPIPNPLRKESMEQKSRR